MTIRMGALTGFGGRRRGVLIVGEVLGNSAGGDDTTHALGSIDVGLSNGDKNIILGITWKDAAVRTISSFTVGGVSLSEKVTRHISGTFDMDAAIWGGDISSISGSQAISVTFNADTQSVGVSGVVIQRLQSLTPTMTASDSTGSGAEMTLTALAAPPGGLAFACGSSRTDSDDATWVTLTERVDISTAGITDHRHSAAWNIGERVAANATLDFDPGTSESAVVGAGFR